MDRKKVFRTDTFTLVSYTLLVLSYSLFFGALIAKFGRLSLSSVLLLLLIIPVVAYFVFLLKKKVVLTDEGIEVFGITGRKRIKWSEVEEVSLTPGRRYFLFIVSKEGNLAVVDDSVSNFRELLKEVEERVPDKVNENFDKLRESYKRSYTSNAVILIASLILLFILFKSII